MAGLGLVSFKLTDVHAILWPQQPSWAQLKENYKNSMNNLME